jgi:hypothetical protein
MYLNIPTVFVALRVIVAMSRLPGCPRQPLDCQLPLDDGTSVRRLATSL